MGTAVIIGVGGGLSASLARKLAKRGHSLVLAARDPAKLAELAKETDAATVACNATNADDMKNVFDVADRSGEPLDVAVYNPSGRVSGAVTELNPEDVKNAILTTSFGAFLMAQQAARRMVPRGAGCILFTGASAGIKGFPNSSSFAMGKFALRGLAQSMARELHPQNIHIVHVVVDGGIKSTERGRGDGNDDRGPDAWLDPDAIADTYYHLHTQHRSSWSWEIEVRPWVEKF
jgi:NAD(P)-dependent dehydrogenase (short-subunit alcohol dehydrogenase family)